MQYLLPKNNVLPKYLYYVVKYMHLEKYYSGATIPHIYYEDYKNEEFDYVPLNRQTQIIEILDNIENTIFMQKCQIEKFDKLIKARFIEMFGIYPANEKGWNDEKIKNIVSEVRYGSSRPTVEDSRYLLTAYKKGATVK